MEVAETAEEMKSEVIKRNQKKRWTFRQEKEKVQKENEAERWEEEEIETVMGQKKR